MYCLLLCFWLYWYIVISMCLGLQWIRIKIRGSWATGDGASALTWNHCICFCRSRATKREKYRFRLRVSHSLENPILRHWEFQCSYILLMRLRLGCDPDVARETESERERSSSDLEIVTSLIQCSCIRLTSLWLGRNLYVASEREVSDLMIWWDCGFVIR